MKKAAIIFCCIASVLVLSCDKKSKETDTVEIDSTTMPTPEASNEIENLSDTVKVSPLDFIKKEVSYINSAGLKSDTHTFKCDENITISYYYENEDIRKIIIDWGTVGDAYHKDEFYYSSGKLIFDYDFVEGGPACEGCQTTLERRSYIKDDKVLLHLRNRDTVPCTVCSFTDSYLAYKMLNAKKTTEDLSAILCR